MLKGLFFCVKGREIKVTRTDAFLYIGGSYPQLRSIETIKNLGIVTILTDRSPNPPLKSISDHFYNIDATDLESFMKLGDEIANKFNLIGVYPIEDYAVPAATAIAEKFNLPYFDDLTAEILLNKYKSFDICSRNNILTPNSILIKSDSDIIESHSNIVDELGLPFLLKPVSSWGSQGVTIIHTVDKYEFSKAINLAREFSQEIIAQEVITGTVHNVDGLLLDKIYYPCNSYDRLPNIDFENVTKSILEPSGLPVEYIESMHNILNDTAKVMNLKNGPITGDFIFSKGSIYLLEISPHFHSIHQASIRTNGVHNPMKAWVSYLLGTSKPEDILNYQPTPGTSVMSSSWTDKSGEILEIFIDEDINNINEVRDVYILYEKGDSIISKISSWNCIALIWGFSNKRTSLLKAMDDASELIKVEFIT